MVRISTFPSPVRSIVWRKPSCCASFQSAWCVQPSLRGSAGASSQPFGVRMSARPSPFTSPAPMPWPKLPGATTCFSHVPFFASYLASPAIVVEVGEDSELDREAAVDGGVDPCRIGLARIAVPRDPLGEPADRDEVGAPVAIDVERKIAEGVEVVAREGNLTKAVWGPRRGLIPEIAGDDVQATIAVDVEDRCRLAGAVVDLMDDERDVRRPAGAEADQRGERHEARQD